MAYILSEFPRVSETFARREIESLRELGWEVLILAARPGNGAAEMPDNGLLCRPRRLSLTSCHGLLWLMAARPMGVLRLLGLFMMMLLECPKDAGMLAWNLPAVAVFARQLRQRHVERLHAYFLSWPACVGAGIAAVLRTPFSIAAHARDIFVEPGAARAKISRADFIVTCTRQGLSALREILSGNQWRKIHIIRHGINLDMLPRESSAAKRQPPRILAVGRLVPKKGFRCLLEALTRVSRHDVRLLIAGDGPEKPRLREQAERLGISGRVELLGQLRNQRILDLMTSCDMLAVPSVIAADGDRDGLPNVILEAFACGLPVIASRLPGIGEAVLHEQTGLMAEPDDSASLARAVERLLNDPALARELAARARAHLEACHDLRKNSLALARLMKSPCEDTIEDCARG